MVIVGVVGGIALLAFVANAVFERRARRHGHRLRGTGAWRDIREADLNADIVDASGGALRPNLDSRGVDRRNEPPPDTPS